ncbi:MAG TPA: glycosyltransferase family 4 protein [Candidatus Sulfotelmatobacter sp.]|nr:glycosyltransferase family 4 protein [Candidatus Sulfotelmatobacter sp.]
MPTVNTAERSGANELAIPQERVSARAAEIGVGILTGCQDRPYAFGLTMALIAKGARVDMIGSDLEDSPELHITPNLRFLNFRGGLHENDRFVIKLYKLMRYYGRLARYVMSFEPRVLHILWNNKIEYFDRTLLMLYYKILGKKIAFTVHNVNEAKRDRRDSWHNRLTLTIQYRLSDHLFVHTKKMKEELLQDFYIPEKAVTVIRHPINNAFPESNLSCAEAKHQLGLKDSEKAILFLGRIKPYKGIEYLLAAFQQLLKKDASYRLIIAGEPHKGSEEYLGEIQRMVEHDFDQGQVLLKVQFIPDEQMELYLKAADVLVLPYKDIFQSGILFLAYSFGLPVVATDVGSFKEEIVEGETGFICKPGDATDMARALESHFSSDIYKDFGNRRQGIKDYADRVHSWDAVAELTMTAYSEMLGRHSQ